MLLLCTILCSCLFKKTVILYGRNNLHFIYVMCALLLLFVVIVVFVLTKFVSAYKLLEPVILNFMKISSASLGSLYVNEVTRALR